ncbi:MAG: outer membrane protein assembly factor BamD [Chloracidobacterium sp.]|nr:outer membrane protein assembly factor BamD [Chloracidobacterium sp.]
MKKIFALTFLVLAVSVIGTFAQRNVTPAIDRDPIMEADAKHNLDVAWNYYSLKKAYKATLMRFEETFAAYPDFSKIDEFLFIGGMSSYYLSEGKGKQPVDLKNEKDKEKYTPEKLRESAKMYLTMLVDKYPDSKYVVDAKKTLNLIK